jgi:hypothetical protein
LLLAILVAIIFYGLPYFSKGYLIIDVNKYELRNHLAKDYLLLRSLLTQPFRDGDKMKIDQLMKEFFDVQEDTAMPYTGLVLLDKNKRVFNACSTRLERVSEKMMGYSYAGIEFQRVEESIHSVLVLYHADKDHPMGQKVLEVAFEIEKDNQRLGWLVFQLDSEFVEREYGINEEDLKEFKFKKS